MAGYRHRYRHRFRYHGQQFLSGGSFRFRYQGQRSTVYGQPAGWKLTANGQ